MTATTRDRVLRDLREHPGSRVSEVSQRLSLDLHVTAYYLRRLRVDGAAGYRGPRHQAVWSATGDITRA
jgi:predicted transcriptional regulator